MASLLAEVARKVVRVVGELLRVAVEEGGELRRAEMVAS